MSCFVEALLDYVSFVFHARKIKGFIFLKQFTDPLFFFQPPLWMKYQQQVKDWEQAMSNANLGFASICQEKATSVEKPPMFAFCMKPRGLEVPNKGSKQRSHRKISGSGHNHVVSRDQDGLHPFGTSPANLLASFPFVCKKTPLFSYCCLATLYFIVIS